MEKSKDIISTSLQKIGRVSMRTESRYHLMNCIQEESGDALYKLADKMKLASSEHIAIITVLAG